MAHSHPKCNGKYKKQGVGRRILRDITVGGEDAPAPAGKPLPASAPAR
jgi:hypothetical protein